MNTLKTLMYVACTKVSIVEANALIFVTSAKYMYLFMHD